MIEGVRGVVPFSRSIGGGHDQSGPTFFWEYPGYFVKEHNRVPTGEGERREKGDGAILPASSTVLNFYSSRSEQLMKLLDIQLRNKLPTITLIGIISNRVDRDDPRGGITILVKAAVYVCRSAGLES